MFEVGKTYHITGILTGRSGEYLVAPRDVNDIELADNINQTADMEARIYPNPFNDKLVLVQLNDVTDVTILNVLGQKVYHKTTAGVSEMIINTESLEKGIYIVSLHNKQGIIKAIRIIRN